MKPLRVPRVRRLLEAMRSARVLVVGDVMLDEFIWGNVGRISPEAPVPVVEVSRQSFHVGGAGNVAHNVRSLGGEAVLAGVVGQDDPARRIREALASAGVEAQLAASDGARPTTVKTRIIAHHQQVVRADWELTDDIADPLQGDLIRRIRGALPACRVLVVSDYQKGVVTPHLMKSVLPLARRRGIPVLVDPKLKHFALYRRVSLVTPNQLEAERASGIRIRSQQELEAAATRILKLLRCDAVLITRGEHGMSLFERDRRPVHITTAAQEVFDVTGAGDTVIATLSLAIAAGASLAEAAVLANHTAGIVVGKLGTATATPSELLATIGPAGR